MWCCCVWYCCTSGFMYVVLVCVLYVVCSGVVLYVVRVVLYVVWLLLYVDPHGRPGACDLTVVWG